MNKYMFLLAFTGLLIQISCETKEQEQPNDLTGKKVKYVKSEPVEEREIVRPVFAFGKLATLEESKLSFKIGGIIRSIEVNEGQRVRKGQVLARLDAREIDAQVTSAKASFVKSEMDLNRMEKLLDEKVVTLESYEQVKTQYEVALSNLQIAEFNKTYSVITAPADGRILRKYVESNELVNAGNPIFLVGGSSREMIVKAGLSDKEVVHLMEGDSASIEFDALPGQGFKGEVLIIGNAPDQVSNLYEIKIALGDYSQALRNGFFAKVKIYPSKLNTFKLIPMEALVEGKERQGYVYTVEDSRAKRLKVDVVDIYHDQLVVRNSDVDFDLIITEGAQYLDPNDELEIVNN